jgi:uncharacterized protein YjbJ (UPF0337 family)
MNLDQLKGNWKQLKGNLKSEFGELTDDEVMQAEGDAESLSGIVQEKYGLTKEPAEDKIDAFMAKHS